jgi:hypothetical protein
MMNGSFAQATVAPSALGDGRFPCGEGIQFDGDVCTPEEQRLEAIKNKILKKLAVRLDAPSFSGRSRDRPVIC